MSTTAKWVLTIAIPLFWAAVVRTVITGAPDRSMGLLDMIPLGLIWWVWEQKPEWKQKPDVSGSHDPNAPKEAGEARDRYFIDKAREKWDRKKSSAPKKKTPVSEAARAKGVESDRIIRERIDKKARKKAAEIKKSDRIIREIIDKKARKKAAATKKKAAPKKKTPVREAARARKKSSALITVCESCGGKISKRLDSCPHCGWSTKPTISCPDCGASFAASLPACPECGGPRR